VAVEDGRFDEARVFLGEGVELAGRIGDSEDVAWCLIALAAVAAASQQPLDGARLLGFTDALLRQIGATMKPFEQTLHSRTEALLAGALGAEPFADARAEGERLELAEAVALVGAELAATA
jgi:hypothetical protein